MSVWDTYEERIGIRGNSKRNAVKRQEILNIQKRLPENMSYTDVTIDGVAQTVAIINSDNLNEKRIISLPGEDIRHGGLVDWMDQHWLVVERDANTTLYTRAKLLQCNYLLKWVTGESGNYEIHEQWCCVEDGTKLSKRIVSVRRDPYEKRPIELLEYPESYVYYNVTMKYA